MSSNSFFNQKSISKIKKIHKGFLWVATGVLIASLLLGIILIFVDSKSDMFGKVQGTFGILALAAFICVNNFIRIEKGNKTIQGFALTGFLANIVWLTLGILMIWGALSPVELVTMSGKSDNAIARTYNYYDEYEYLDSDYDYSDSDYDSDYDYDQDDYDYYSDYEMDDVYRTVAAPSQYTPTTLNISVAARIMIIAVSLASIGFWVSNVLAIKNRVKSVIPLKITAVVCELFGSISVIILAFCWPISFDQNIMRWVQLSGLATSGFIVMALAAWIVSITHKDFDSTPAIIDVEDVKSDGVSKKIEEKPLMRGKTAEKDEKKDLPPLQADDMPPAVKRDGEVKLTAPVETEVFSEESNTAVASESTEPIESAAEIIESVEFTEGQGPESEAPVQAQEDTTSVQGNDTPNPLQ